MFSPHANTLNGYICSLSTYARCQPVQFLNHISLMAETLQMPEAVNNL